MNRARSGNFDSLSILKEANPTTITEPDDAMQPFDENSRNFVQLKVNSSKTSNYKITSKV